MVFPMSGRTAEATSRVGGAADLIRKDLAELMRLAWPVVFARLGIMTMGLTDALVVGQFSAVQLGYHALGWAPTIHSVSANVPRLLEEFRNNREAA